MLQSFSKKCPKGSLQIMLQCYRCKQRPDQQFILLLCDHLICSSCLNKFSSMRNNGYEGIKCPCGVLTYFRVVQENQRRKYISGMGGGKQYEEDNGQQDDIEEEQQTRIHVPMTTECKQRNKKNIKNLLIKTNQNNWHRGQKLQLSRDISCPSIGINHSKNTTSTKNISRFNTESFSQINTQSQRKLNVNSYNDSTPDYLRDQAMLEKSKYPLQTKKAKVIDREQSIGQERETGGFKQPQIQRIPKNKQIVDHIHNQHVDQYCSYNLHFQPRYIQSESAISENIQNISQKQNANPNPNQTKLRQHSHKKSRTKTQIKTHSYHSQQCSEESQEEETNSQENSKNKKQKKENQLVQQLNSQIQYLLITHKKLLGKLSRVYNRALNNINQDYNKLQNNLKNLCFQNILMDRSDSHLDLGKIIKLRYENYIGKNIQKLIEEIKRYGYKDDFTSGIQKFTKDFSKSQHSSQINQIKEYQLQKFDTPHLYPIDTQTEPVYFNTTSKISKNYSLTELPCSSQVQTKQHPSYQQCKKNHQYLNPINSQLYQYGQNGHKLQKKGIKRKTNIIIQL